MSLPVALAKLWRVQVVWLQQEEVYYAMSIFSLSLVHWQKYYYSRKIAVIESWNFTYDFSLSINFIMALYEKVWFGFLAC